MAAAVTRATVDPLWLAQSRLRRRRLDGALEIVDYVLSVNALDKGAWLLKTQILVEKDYVDECELEEETLAESVMREETLNTAPRPGTSLHSARRRQRTGTGQGFRPVSATGRLLTGFMRPSTQNTSSGALRKSLASRMRTGTGARNRPLTMSGRRVRLGTQSLLSKSDKFIDGDSLNCARFARNTLLTKWLVAFLTHCERNVRKALQLAAQCTKKANFDDWFWKLKLAQCYYQLSLFREAEKQLLSALRMQPMVETFLHLTKVYLKLDQPMRALAVFSEALASFPKEKHLVLGKARVYEMMNDMDASVALHSEVLRIEPSSVEAMASLGAHHFYEKPQLALRYYRRLLQMGVQNAAVWNNLALCCFFAAQFHLCFPCFSQAFALAAADCDAADVWFNLSVVAIHTGDLQLAARCLSVALSIDDCHAEACNNLAVIANRNGDDARAALLFERSRHCGEHLFEPCFNGALLAFAAGNCQDATQLLNSSLRLFPEHSDSLQLQSTLKHTLNQSL